MATSSLLGIPPLVLIGATQVVLYLPVVVSFLASLAQAVAVFSEDNGAHLARQWNGGWCMLELGKLRITRQTSA